MKKSFLLLSTSLFCVCLHASETMYAGSVKNLYESQDSTSKKGRLLPTSKVKVLDNTGEKVKIQLEGYRKSGTSNAIYFVQGKRILVAGLSKSGKFEVEVLSTNKDEKNVTWEKVALTAYTKKDNLVKELSPLYTQAQELYKNNCSICHPAHPEHEFTANQWPSMFKAMVNRTAIEKKDWYLITQYLQKHAKDIEGKHHEKH